MRVTAVIIALLGAALGCSALPAQSISPGQAPAAWLRYAEGATRDVTGWLQEDSEAGVGLRTYLEGLRPAADQQTPALRLKLWIDTTGKIERVDFAPFAHEEANAAVRKLTMGRMLAGSPPCDMRQPLHLAVQLDPSPAE